MLKENNNITSTNNSNLNNTSNSDANIGHHHRTRSTNNNEEGEEEEGEEEEEEEGESSRSNSRSTSICFSKLFIKSFALFVGVLGLLLTVILLSVSFSHIKDLNNNNKYFYIPRLHLPLWVLDSIDIPRLKTHVKYLSSDLLEGRAPGTRGESLAISYVESIFHTSNIKPFGNFGQTKDQPYFQNVPFFGFSIKLEDEMVFKDSKSDSPPPTIPTLKIGQDYVCSTQQSKKEIIDLSNIPMVFVGYGIKSENQNWNDFKNFDIKNKILITLVGYPEKEFNTTNSYTGRYSYKFEEGSRQGALGVLLIHTTESAGYTWDVIKSSYDMEHVVLDGESNKGNLEVTGWITKDIGEKLAGINNKKLSDWIEMAHSRDFHPIDLPLKMSVKLKVSSPRTFNGTNVIGGIKGKTEPEKMVVVMAHHDHLGSYTDPKTGKQVIFHGAIDNASGLGAMLEISTILGLFNKIIHTPSFSEIGPPRTFNRSVVFVATTGEEFGLLGAQYFLNSISNQSNIVSVINFDGFNIYGETNDSIPYGQGLSPQLDTYFKEVCESEGMVPGPDPMPQMGILFRNDQLPFLVSGVPALTLGLGSKYRGEPSDYFQNVSLHYFSQIYHHPEDQFKEEWSFKGAVQQIRIASRLTYYLSSSIIETPKIENQILI
eukprot:gene864-1078_t